jgi:3'-phosphoadenosine 5'-phosphosulfate sulfotransferase (PAPS reductase)/FAD synthetase
MERNLVDNPRHLVWFSCGAASAVVAKLAVQSLSNVEVLYCDMSQDEHLDNRRFLSEVEQWIGQAVTRLKGKYNSINDVFERERYMSGIAGARCTIEMKKKLRFEYQRPGDVHLFGFTSDEETRIKRFQENNHDLNTRWLLQERGITKEECYGVLKFVGIDLPAMYKLGFKNNNCIGCVKASSPSYWALVRQVAPDKFEERAKLSRELGCRLIQMRGKRLFLDELPPGRPEDFKRYRQEDISCGPECGSLPAE